MAMHTLTYHVVLTRDGEGWMATVPDIQGCITCGDTVEEAEAMAKDAIELLLADMTEDGESLPQPSAKIINVTVDVPEAPHGQTRTA